MPVVFVRQDSVEPDRYLVCVYRDHGYSYHPDCIVDTMPDVMKRVDERHADGYHAEVYPLYGNEIGSMTRFPRPDSEEE